VIVLDSSALLMAVTTHRAWAKLDLGVSLKVMA
jgi:hypothetical protein